MPSLNKHIILIGFKHVGKSAVGIKLAEKLGIGFQDSDKVLEILYEKEFGKSLSCREIMKTHGEAFFRQQESYALKQVISTTPRVLALGGGTPIALNNQALIKPHIVIHLTTPKGIAFERIVMHGRPSFFSPDEDLLVTFNRLWETRESVYRQLSPICINNNSEINLAVNAIIQHLQTECVEYEF